MKKLLGALILFLTLFSLPLTLRAAQGDPMESTDRYRVFLSFGGDRDKSKDWKYEYTGEKASDGMTVTDAMLGVGETVTVSISFDAPVLKTWTVEPVLIGENILDAEFAVQVLIDGQEVDVLPDQGPNWWYSDTGVYKKDVALRIGGGYNEWNNKYLSKAPEGFTEISFVITANHIFIPEPAPVPTPEPEKTEETPVIPEPVEETHVTQYVRPRGTGVDYNHLILILSLMILGELLVAFILFLLVALFKRLKKREERKLFMDQPGQINTIMNE